MIIHSNASVHCGARAVLSQRARDCDGSFIGTMNNQAALSSSGSDGELERWRGGGEVTRPDMLFWL